jgi:GNAT superfamily N-acetyltransferase
MITFGLVDEGQAHAVYQWHRGFTSANAAVRQRTRAALDQLIEDRSLWHASEAGDYLGLAYASHDFERHEVEIGGLMVAEAARSRGVGSTLMQLALAHILISQRPLRTPAPGSWRTCSTPTRIPAGSSRNACASARQGESKNMDLW